MWLTIFSLLSGLIIIYIITQSLKIKETLKSVFYFSFYGPFLPYIALLALTLKVLKIKGKWWR